MEDQVGAPDLARSFEEGLLTVSIPPPQSELLAASFCYFIAKLPRGAPVLDGGGGQISRTGNSSTAQFLLFYTQGSRAAQRLGGFNMCVQLIYKS